MTLFEYLGIVISERLGRAPSCRQAQGQIDVLAQLSPRDRLFDVPVSHYFLEVALKLLPSYQRHRKISHRPEYQRGFSKKEERLLSYSCSAKLTVEEGHIVISSRDQIYLEWPESQTKGNRVAMFVAMMVIEILLIANCIHKTKCVSGILTISWRIRHMDPKAKDTSSPENESSMA